MEWLLCAPAERSLMVGMGHEDQFRPQSRNGRYRLGEATFARASGNDEVAPIPAVRTPTD